MSTQKKNPVIHMADGSIAAVLLSVNEREAPASWIKIVGSAPAGTIKLTASLDLNYNQLDIVTINDVTLLVANVLNPYPSREIIEFENHPVNSIMLVTAQSNTNEAMVFTPYFQSLAKQEKAFEKYENVIKAIRDSLV